MDAPRRVYDQQVCHICTTGLPVFPYLSLFRHTLGFNGVRNMIFLAKPMFLKPRNQMEALRIVYDQQGCQIYTTGLPVIAYLSVLCIY